MTHGRTYVSADKVHGEKFGVGNCAVAARCIPNVSEKRSSAASRAVAELARAFVKPINTVSDALTLRPHFR